MRPELRSVFFSVALTSLVLQGCEENNHELPPAIPVSATATIQLTAVPQAPALEVIGEQVKRSSIGSSLRTIESEKGKSQLDFEEAKALVPKILQLYHEGTESSVITGDLQSSFFIVRDRVAARIYHDSMTLEEVKRIPQVDQLLADYQETGFSEEELRRVAMSSANGFALNGKIFLDLDSANENSGTEANFRTLFHPLNQFYSISLETACSPLGPTGAFIKTSVHELFHRDLYEDMAAPEPTIEELFKGSKRKVDPIHPLAQYGFGILGEIPRIQNSFAIPLYEEISADYMAARILIANGLGFYASDYSDPQKLFNLGQIYTQSGIDDITLLDLHRNHQLVELMKLIGKGALNNSDDQLKLGFNIGETISDFNDNTWSDIRPYFPSVVSSKYRCIS